MGKDLSQKVKVLEDDVSFLLEVKEDHSAATPDMDPEHELEALKIRFTRFQREFQVRGSLTLPLLHLLAVVFLLLLQPN